MSARATVVQGALAAAGLVAAFVTWQRPKEERTEDSVVLVDAARKDIEKIRFEDGTRWMELERTVDGQAVVWVRQGMFEEKVRALAAAAAADAGTPDAGQADAGAGDGGSADGGWKHPTFMPPAVPPVAQPVVLPPRLMRGGERAEKAWDKFAPLRAARGLGRLGEDKRKELGLAGSERRLSITVGGSTRSFIASNPQGGVVGTYLQDEKDGAVYLLGGALLGELDPGSQALVDRRLHAFKAADFDTFEVTVEGTSRTFVQTGAEIPQTMKVAPLETPDKPDELVRNWHDKVLHRLVVTEVLGKGEVPRGGEPTVALRVRYVARQSDKGFLELARGSGTDLWARTENTAGWVGVHAGADDVLAEARKVAGLP